MTDIQEKYKELQNEVHALELERQSVVTLACGRAITGEEEAKKVFPLKRKIGCKRLAMRKIMQNASEHELELLSHVAGSLDFTTERGRRNFQIGAAKLFDVVIKKQGLVERAKYRKPSFNIHNYCVGTKDNRKTLAGVFHNNGYAVATDTYVLVADKELYDAAHEGQVVDKNGEMLGKSHLPWQLVWYGFVEAAAVDFQDLYAFVQAVRNRIKEAKKNEGLCGVLLKFPSGRVMSFKVKLLDKFLRAAIYLGATELETNGSGLLHVAKDDGSMAIVCMYKDEESFNLRTGMFDTENLWAYDLSKQRDSQNEEQDERGKS